MSPFLYTAQNERIIVGSISLSKAVLVVRYETVRIRPVSDAFVNQQGYEKTAFQSNNSIVFLVSAILALLQEADNDRFEPDCRPIFVPYTFVAKAKKIVIGDV